LFFALWPEPETAQAIWQATRSLVPKGVGRRLVPAHIHLTLAFLGSLNEAQERCVRQVADRVPGAPFTLELDQAGHFPRPQVVWLGTRQMPTALQGLQSKLVSQLIQSCDYEPEARPFVPHITLWRKVRRVSLPETIAAIPWPVSHFVLARSRTLPSGAEYSIVQEWPLLDKSG
jgi:2'-5' RNA ligase